MFCCCKLFTGNSGVPLRKVERNEIQLDVGHMGNEVVIIKGGMRICGQGGCLATSPLVQSKSYFEVKLQQTGNWAVGLATRQADLNSKGGLDKESWCLGSDNCIRHDGNVLHELAERKTDPDSTSLTDNLLPEIKSDSEQRSGIPAEGDTIGVAYDHVELNFFLNGKNLEVPVLNVKGRDVYPALFVDDGAILDIVLDNFKFGPPPGFERILIEQSLL